MAKWFDMILEDDTYGEKTWEKSESKMLKQAILMALQKSGRDKEDIDTILSGDLINQIIVILLHGQRFSGSVHWPLRRMLHHDGIHDSGFGYD
jgi:stage V sporulation protein AD